MSDETSSNELKLQLDNRPRANLALLPTPLHPLMNFSQHFDGQEIWMKRDDLTGLEGGGNKTRKLWLHELCCRNSQAKSGNWRTL